LNSSISKDFYEREMRVRINKSINIASVLYKAEERRGRTKLLGRDLKFLRKSQNIRNDDLPLKNGHITVGGRKKTKLKRGSPRGHPSN